MGEGSILHVNAVGLMAAIEEGFEPFLRGRPFVIAEEAAGRPLVLDLSPEAHREGLRRGMLLSQARLRLPGLAVRRPRPDLYRLADEGLGRVCREYSPLVEAAGAGHLFVELAGTRRLHGPPADAAQKIRSGILAATGLRPALALASSKTVSKVATRVIRPAGFVALEGREEAELLRRQPVGLLPGVGPVLLARFALLGIEEIGDLAALAEFEGRALGPRGPELLARARGLDASPVDPEPAARRVLRGELLFEPDTCDPELLRLRLAALLAELAFGLRKEGLGARRAAIHLSYTDGRRSEASQRSARLLSRDDELLGLCLAALERARSRRVRIRRLRLELSEQDSAGPELDLFEPGELKLLRLQTALDRVRGRYGPAALAPASLLALEQRTKAGATPASLLALEQRTKAGATPASLLAPEQRSRAGALPV